MFRVFADKFTRGCRSAFRKDSGTARNADNENRSSAKKCLDSHPNTSGNDSKPFVMLEEDKYVIPVFDIHRYVGNVIAQLKYRYFFEKEFSTESFLNGAVQAAVLCADCIRRGDWGNLRRIMTEEAVAELQTRFDPFCVEDFERLNISINDVICSVINSSFTCGKTEPGVSGFRSFLPLKHRAFYSQVIIYIKKGDIDMSKSIEHLLWVSPPRSMLICNITLSRILNPLGIWKVTRINFFDYP